jgi:hypothetical protein
LKSGTFQLTGISREPVVHQSWYQGKWLYLPHAFGLVDYVVFPSSLYLQIDEKVLYLQYTLQDNASYMAKFNFREVLASLVRFNDNGITCQ